VTPFDPRVFFQPVDGLTVKVRIDGGTPIDAFFDAAYIDALGVMSATPAVTCLSEDVTAAVQGSQVALPDGDYVVASIEPDGAGITVLRLHKR
jgi:hypothetical protein